VTPECGAWRRASGLCSFAKEHMKRERERVKGKQREVEEEGKEKEKGLQCLELKVGWATKKKEAIKRMVELIKKIRMGEGLD
jgi:hypothetical protein